MQGPGQFASLREEKPRKMGDEARTAWTIITLQGIARPFAVSTTTYLMPGTRDHLARCSVLLKRKPPYALQDV